MVPPQTEAVQALPLLQQLFLGWILDTRTEDGELILEPSGVEVADESPAKGKLTHWCARNGVLHQSANQWRQSIKFQNAFREAAALKFRDPTHMSAFMARLVELATADLICPNPKCNFGVVKPSEAIKAVETYARLAGFEPSKVQDAPITAADLSDEELEARSGLRIVS